MVPFLLSFSLFLFFYTGAPLLAVHAPQRILDQGVAQGWWKALHYPNPSNPSSTQINLVATPQNKPYQKAQQCSKQCDIDGCGGFSFTHEICLLRGKTYQPTLNAGYVAKDTCRATNEAVRSDAVTGPSDVAAKAEGKCQRLERSIPQPAGEYFQQCNLPRCTTVESLNGGNWHDWNLDAPFPTGTRDFVYYPSKKNCFLPAYNRSEIRTLLGGEGAPLNNEAWLIIAGGSNSFGMAATVMKAVHNDGTDPPKLVQIADSQNAWTGRGINKYDSNRLNMWSTNCVVGRDLWCL